MRLAGEEPRGEVPANGVESTPLSKGSVGDNAIGRRLAVDLENGRDGENGGRSPGMVVWVVRSGYEVNLALGGGCQPRRAYERIQSIPEM